MGSGRKRDEGPSGCLTVVVVAAVSCALYVFNTHFSSGILAAAGPHFPLILQQPKVVQMMTLILPVALLFLEWWLIFTFGAALRHAIFGSPSIAETPAQAGSEAAEDRSRPNVDNSSRQR